MPKTRFNVTYLLPDGSESEDRMDKERLEVLMEQQPIIEIEECTYEIDRVNYDTKTERFYFFLLDY